MDSLSQIVLGASLGVAVMGRRTALWKAALWGGLCGTLPDLDALVDHGDPILDMTLHRGDSHSLLWLTLLAPVLAAAAAGLHRQWPLFGRWWLALWLAPTVLLLALCVLPSARVAAPLSQSNHATKGRCDGGAGSAAGAEGSGSGAGGSGWGAAGSS